MKELAKVIGIYTVLFFAVLFGTEAYVAFLLNNPKYIPVIWEDSLRGYYMQKDRKIAQYLPSIAQYDSLLFYKLKPGKHAFNNREFETTFSVNPFGLRDDENALHKPSIICLGDSYTMGWGVNDDESFPSLLEKTTGKTVLNAGVSSYGTVREWELLKMLDTSNLEAVIIQFDANDNNENVSFFHNGKFTASSLEKYLKTSTNHTQATKYFPLKHVSHFVSDFFKKQFPTNPEKAASKEENTEEEKPYVAPVDAFLNVLNSFHLPNDVTVIVFQVGSAGTDILIDRLNERKAANKLGHYQQIKVVNMQSKLTEKDYYKLDLHLTAEGHRKVSEELSKHLYAN